jgi:hypothetical protein
MGDVPFGRTTRRKTGEREGEDKGESTVWRFLVVMGLLLAVVSLGGGLTASADTGEDDEVDPTEKGILQTAVVGAVPALAPLTAPSIARPAGNGSKASHHLASGALSGLTSAVILQPLDLLKTRLQQGTQVDRTKR